MNAKGTGREPPDSKEDRKALWMALDTTTVLRGFSMDSKE